MEPTGKRHKVRFGFRLKLIGLVALSVGLAAAASLAYSTYILRDNVITSVQDRVAVMAATSALGIRGEDLEAVTTPEDYRKPEYARIYNALAAIYLATEHRRVKLDNVYALRVDPNDPAGQRVIFAAHLPGDVNFPHGLAPIERMSDPDVNYIGNDLSYTILPEMKAVLYRGAPSSATGIYIQEPWGAWISGFAPIKTSDGRIVGLLEVDYDLNFIESYLFSQVLKIATAVLAVLLIVLGLSVLLADSFVRPVYTLGRAVDEFAAGNYGKRVQLRRGDEFDLLGDHFNDMAQSLEEKLHLSKYVSPDTLRRVSGQTSHEVTAGSRKHVVCFFADVRGFTAYSEHHPVEQVISMLNDLLERQTRIILEHGGGIDKFVGDEVMATFEGDDGLERALRAALRIQAEPLEHTTVSIEIGVHAGEVIQGDIGSRDRKDFTVIGSTVNLAARLCSAAGPGQILVTEPVWATLPGDFQSETLAPLHLKGISDPVAVRNVTG